MARQDDTVINFGEEIDANSRLFKHPVAVSFHLLFRAVALAVYIFASILTSSYIVCFLMIIFLLSMDFWTVKNITGRLLVGLRWWNFVDDEGNSHWKFEARKDDSRTDQKEARIFWLALVLTPAIWLILALISFFTFKMSWLIVTVMGMSMTGANLYGYLRCKWSSRQELTSYLQTTMFKSLLTRAAQDATRPQQPQNQN